MNIGPTQIVPVAAENEVPVKTARNAGSPPASENISKMESVGNGAPATPVSFAQEVVNVHPDTSTGQQILVYEFVDSKSGSLVYQIPSQQMLNLVQEIRQRLQQMSAKHLGEAAAKPEGDNGNQL